MKILCRACAADNHQSCMGDICGCGCPFYGAGKGLRAAVARNRRALGESPQTPAGDCYRCHQFETVARIVTGKLLCVVCDYEMEAQASGAVS